MFAVVFAAVVLSDFANSGLHQVWGQSRWRDVVVTFLFVFSAWMADWFWVQRKSGSNPS
jgi:hypothetical protein